MAGVWTFAGCLDSSEESETLPHQAKLLPKDGDRRDWFGGAVTVSANGSIAIIGAHNDNGPSGERTGSAYVFAANDGSWSQQAKPTAEDGDSDDFFGAVALSGDGNAACIGATGDNTTNGVDAGSAYVFEANNESWSQQAKLAPADGDKLDHFGAPVAMSDDGTTALVGVIYDDTPKGEDAGSACVFTL